MKKGGEIDMKRTIGKLVYPENVIMRKYNTSYWADGTQVICRPDETTRLAEQVMRPALLCYAARHVNRCGAQ